MKNKYNIALRVTLLVLISTGIFISSFHSHSDLDWVHSEEHCPTGRHLADHHPFCPICTFRLVGPPSEPVLPMTVQSVISVIHENTESIIAELFTAPVNGRSPPTFS